ncbi:MAG: polyprenyl synthetase family protein [Salibacteraceae bacterium]
MMVDEILTPYQQLIESALADLPLPKEPARLFDPLRHTLGNGGKRIRPVLTLLTCELFDAPAEKAIHQAIAVELFHNFTLIHDDFMDDAPLRRGQPTVYSKWGANVAVLSGDALIVLAYDRLRLNAGERLHDLMEMFNDCALNVCVGQQLDMDYAQKGAISSLQYREMIRLKTGILLGLSCGIGAMMAGAASHQVAAVRKFAEHLGIAFQIKDDLLDAFGNQGFGKKLGGDIAEGKHTWLVVKALEVANASQKNELQQAFALSDDKSKIERVTALFRKLGLEEMGNEAVKSESETALSALKSVKGNPRAMAKLETLTNALIWRTV